MRIFTHPNFASLIPQVRKRYRLLLDAWLQRLSRSSGALSHGLIKVFEIFAPRVGARIRFRQGSFSQALAIARRSSDTMFCKRLEDMLSELNAPLPQQAPHEFSAAFNQRVLHVVHSAVTFDINGYAVRTEQIVRALRDQGIAVEVMTRLGYPWDLPQHTEKALTSHSRGRDIEYMHTYDAHRGIGNIESEYLQAYADSICEFVRQSGASVIHAHSNYLNGLATAIAGGKMNVPVVYEMRGLWHETRALTNPNYRDTEHFKYCEARELRAAASADTVVAISEPLSDWLVEHGIQSSKIKVIGNASITQQPLALSVCSPPRVGYVGSMVSYEGLDCLVSAMELVIQEKPNVKATLVGDGPYLGKVRALIKDKGLEEVFELTGRVPVGSVRPQYQRFSVAVVPRNSNIVTELIPPLKPMEILSIGVPLIVSNVAPLAAIVTHRQNGLLFESGSADQLASCILEVIGNEQLQYQLARGGGEWAREHSWAHNAKLYRSMYEGLFI